MARNFALAVMFTVVTAAVGFTVTAPPDPPRAKVVDRAPSYRIGDTPRTPRASPVLEAEADPRFPAPDDADPVVALR